MNNNKPNYFNIYPKDRNILDYIYGADHMFRDGRLQKVDFLMNVSSVSIHRLAFWAIGSVALSIVLFLVCFLTLSKPKKMEIEKLTAYECGFSPFEDASGRFDIKFYLVAILFIIFDLEVVFLFPWVLVLRDFACFEDGYDIRIFSMYI